MKKVKWSVREKERESRKQQNGKGCDFQIKSNCKMRTKCQAQ